MVLRATDAVGGSAPKLVDDRLLPQVLRGAAGTGGIVLMVFGGLRLRRRKRD